MVSSENMKLQNMKFFLFFVSSFCHPGSRSGYGSTDLIESGSDPDPKHCPYYLGLELNKERTVTWM
jgi:hypothetical protein